MVLQNHEDKLKLTRNKATGTLTGKLGYEVLTEEYLERDIL